MRLLRYNCNVYIAKQNYVLHEIKGFNDSEDNIVKKLCGYRIREFGDWLQ